MKRCHSSLHRLARWYRNTLHLSRRDAIWAALLEILSCPGYLPPRKARECRAFERTASPGAFKPAAASYPLLSRCSLATSAFIR
jgi:hypothetical protein